MDKQQFATNASRTLFTNKNVLFFIWVTGFESRTGTFVCILLYITGAPGAFFQSLEPGDQQRKIGSLNCKLARAIWAGILWHMLLYTRDMVDFNV